MTAPKNPRQRAQWGAAMVEFALCIGVFLVALIAVLELARFMLLYNTAAEATRLASRLASLCDISAAQQTRIRQRVRYFVEVSGQLSVGERSDWLSLSYLPSNCNATSCLWAEARLSEVQARLWIPVSAITLTLPAYRSVQMRESMRNVIAGESNSSCD